MKSAHAVVVSEWMARVCAGRGSREIVALFGRALFAIWQRADVTLGEITLRAIVRRVFHGAHVRFPVLGSLIFEPAPESFTVLAEHQGSPSDRAALIVAVHALLTELMSLLGALSAEILTPSLHAALRAVDLPVQAAQPALTASSREAAS